MSSGKIGMVFISNNKKLSLARPTNPTPIYTQLNRLTPMSMTTIIHRPSGSCSSCGN
jgi:hypothetical protein